MLSGVRLGTTTAIPFFYSLLCRQGKPALSCRKRESAAHSNTHTSHLYQHKYVYDTLLFIYFTLPSVLSALYDIYLTLSGLMRSKPPLKPAYNESMRIHLKSQNANKFTPAPWCNINCINFKNKNEIYKIYLIEFHIYEIYYTDWKTSGFFVKCNWFNFHVFQLR